MFLILGVLIGMMGGILLGIIIQQMIIEHELIAFGESLEGVNFEVNVDFNETLLIEGFKESLVPLLNKTNKTNNTGDIING